MKKITPIGNIVDKKEKQEKITAYLEQLKDELAEFISECEEDGELEEKIDTLTEALDALEDAYEIISECEYQSG